MHDRHPQRNANRDRYRHGDYDQGQVTGGGFEDLRAVFNEKSPGGHAAGPSNGFSAAVKARTSGSSIFSNPWGPASATICPFLSRMMRDARRSASRRS